jgi:hypothetical protein
MIIRRDVMSILRGCMIIWRDWIIARCDWMIIWYNWTIIGHVTMIIVLHVTCDADQGPNAEKAKILGFTAMLLPIRTVVLCK